MNIKLHKEVAELLKSRNIESVEQFINDITFVYLMGGFIREGEVAQRFLIDKIYRRVDSSVCSVFDEITHEFQGVSVVGKEETETLWIESKALHDALEENTEIIVMKSPRKKGISRKEGIHIEALDLKKEDMS